MFLTHCFHANKYNFIYIYSCIYYLFIYNFTKNHLCLCIVCVFFLFLISSVCTSGKLSWIWQECAHPHREGHTSLVRELEKDLREKPGAIVLSVGGGGLLNGVVEGLRRAQWDDVPIIAMETMGAHSLNAAMSAGKLVTLPAITRYWPDSPESPPLPLLLWPNLTFDFSLQCCDHTRTDSCLCSDHEAGEWTHSCLWSRLRPRSCESCWTICRWEKKNKQLKRPTPTETALHKNCSSGYFNTVLLK